MLLVAAVVAMLARRLNLPYTVGLVAAGFGLAFAPVIPETPLTRDLIFLAFLPPLVFEAAIQIEWGRLRRNLSVVLVLATLGVLISAAVTTVGLHYSAGWRWQAAMLFGVLIAATDPVSVIATFKEVGVRGRLRLLVEAESLFNDGTAAVFFVIALTITTGAHVTALETLGDFGWTFFGGIVCGLAVGGFVLLLAGRTTDHLVEITFTTLAAYGAFYVAEQLGASGVLSTLSAGLLVGNVGPLGAISERGKASVEAFWEFAAFVVNSIIFLLIGMRLAHEHFAVYVLPITAAIGFVLLGRAASVYGCSALFARSKRAVDYRDQHVLFWGGLRGALALALALGLPPGLPEGEAIRAAAFAVVAFSLLVQGLTIRPFLRHLRAIGEADGGAS